MSQSTPSREGHVPHAKQSQWKFSIAAKGDPLPWDEKEEIEPMEQLLAKMTASTTTDCWVFSKFFSDGETHFIATKEHWPEEIYYSASGWSEIIQLVRRHFSRTRL